MWHAPAAVAPTPADPAHPGRVDQDARAPNVAVHDVAAVKVVESRGDLMSHGRFMERPSERKRRVGSRRRSRSSSARDSEGEGEAQREGGGGRRRGMPHPGPSSKKNPKKTCRELLGFARRLTGWGFYPFALSVAAAGTVVS